MVQVTDYVFISNIVMPKYLHIEINTYYFIISYFILFIVYIIGFSITLIFFFKIKYGSSIYLSILFQNSKGDITKYLSLKRENGGLPGWLNL